MSEIIKILYDHYKDSFEQIKSNLIKREQYFIWAALLLFASMFTTFNPSYIQDVANNVSKIKFGIDLNLAFYTINSTIVFLSLWYLMRYYQTVLVIENLYKYIQKIELKLSDSIKDFEISREGKSYLNSYPIIKSCIHSFYFIVLPVIIITASLIKMYWELFKIPAIPLLTLIFDMINLSAMVLLTILYLMWIHYHDFKKPKNEEEK